MFIFVNTKFSECKIFVCFVESVLQKPSIFTSVIIEFFQKRLLFFGKTVIMFLEKREF